jgi:hypothetical protein
MLLVWFGIVLGLALILVLFGYFLSSPPLAIAGAGLIFLLGSIVMFSNLEVKTGYINEINSSMNNVSYVYGSIQEEEVIGVGINHFLGFILSLIGVFIFIDIFTGLRGLK